MRPMNTIAALLAASFLTVPALAAPSAGDAPAAAASRAKGGAKKAKRDPAKRGERMVQRMVKAGISESTAKEIVAIRAGNRSKRQAIRKEMQTHRQKLAQLLKSNSNDQAAYKKSLDGMKAARVKLQTLSASERAAISSKLTPKQQAQLLAAKHRKGKRGAKAKRGAGRTASNF